MKRVLLKLSGEALAGEKKTGFDEETCLGVARQVKKLVDDGIQVAIVTGGGNFWRGRTSETIDRVKADQIGMLPGSLLYKGLCLLQVRLLVQHDAVHLHQCDCRISTHSIHLSFHFPGLQSPPQSCRSVQNLPEPGGKGAFHTIV